MRERALVADERWGLTILLWRKRGGAIEGAGVRSGWSVCCCEGGGMEGKRKYWNGRKNSWRRTVEGV